MELMKIEITRINTTSSVCVLFFSNGSIFPVNTTNIIVEKFKDNFKNLIKEFN